MIVKVSLDRYVQLKRIEQLHQHNRSFSGGDASSQASPSHMPPSTGDQNPLASAQAGPLPPLCQLNQGEYAINIEPAEVRPYKLLKSIVISMRRAFRQLRQVF